MKYFVGIDVGKHGGIVVIDEKEEITAAIPMPIVTSTETKPKIDIIALKNFFALYENDISLIEIERASAMPKNGAVSMFSFGESYGQLQGLLVGMELPFRIVFSRTWQKEILKDLDRTDPKQAAYLFCSRNWPEKDWRATERSKKPHDGIVDAACIALYAKKQAD